MKRQAGSPFDSTRGKAGVREGKSSERKSLDCQGRHGRWPRADAGLWSSGTGNQEKTVLALSFIYLADS